MGTKVYVRIVAESFYGGTTLYRKSIADISFDEKTANDMLWIWEDLISKDGISTYFVPSEAFHAINGRKIEHGGIVSYCWIEEHEVL